MLEENIWLFNYQTIDLLANGIPRDRAITYLEITDKHGERRITRGTRPEGDSLNMMRRELYQSYRDIDNWENTGRTPEGLPASAPLPLIFTLISINTI